MRADVGVTDVFLLFATTTRVANATARVGDGGYAARLAALQLEALRPDPDGGADRPRRASARCSPHRAVARAAAHLVRASASSRA